MLTLNDGRAELWQWDTGRALTVDADCSQVHFSNKVYGRSIDVDVVDGAAIIPDVLLQTDKDLNVWAFVGTAENGYTKISKTFTVNRRNKPADYVFTPTEQTTIAEIAAIAQSVRDDADNGLFDGADGTDGAPGKDGITPTIGDNGNWYLGDTDTGKPSRGDTGPKGEKGETGVYVGSEAPTDTNIKVWIDPEGEETAVDSKLSETSEKPVQNKVITAAMNQISAENDKLKDDIKAVQEAVGTVVPDVQQLKNDVSGLTREYELIEEITVEDGTTEIQRTAEPDGTPYCFKKVYVRIGEDTGSQRIGVDDQLVRIAINYSWGADQSTYSVGYCAGSSVEIEGFADAGSFISIRMVGRVSPYESKTAMERWSRGIHESNKSIKSVIVGQYGGITAGTVIKIWGVRADA